MKTLRKNSKETKRIIIESYGADVFSFVNLFFSEMQFVSIQIDLCEFEFISYFDL